MITAQKPSETFEATQEASTVMATSGPVAAKDRVDALDCEAGALHDVGGRLVCDDHYYEVLRAYWNADPNLVLHHYDEPQGKCGQMVLGRWA